MKLLPAFGLLVGIATLAPGQQPVPPADVVFVLKGHTDTIDAVAISPDGKFIATASFDKTVKLWDATTGKLVRTFGAEKGHTGQVLAVAFSAKSDKLATGGADNKVLIWDVGAKTADPLKTLPHPNLVDAVAFDDTGNVLATGCHDGNLRTFDVTKGAEIKKIEAHVQKTPQVAAHPIYAIAWSPDFKQIFTASYDKSIKLWDVAAGTLVREFKAAPDPTAIAPPTMKKDAKKDDKKEAKKEDKKDVKKEEPPKPPFGHRDQVFTLALTKDGKVLATGSSDRTVKLWDVATGRVVREFPNPDIKPTLPTEPAASHPGWVHTVRFTPDEKHIVSVSNAPRGKGYLAVWSVKDGKRTYGAERDSGPLHSLAITSDGKQLVIGCGPKVRSSPDAEAIILKMPSGK